MAKQRFEFIAGRLSLCFVDTVGGRGGAGIERLTDARSLDDWLASAGLFAERTLPATQRQLEVARGLREAIFRAGLQVMADKVPDRADMAAINAAARRPPLRPQWTGNGVVQTAERPVEAALSVIAADALELFASPLAARIRRCPECAMMFVDTSRPGRRRWCSSARGCGNRAKVNRSRARVRAKGWEG